MSKETEDRVIDTEVKTLEQQLEKAGSVRDMEPTPPPVKEETPPEGKDKVQSPTGKQDVPSDVDKSADAKDEDDDGLDLKDKTPTPDDWKKVRGIVRDLKSQLKDRKSETSATVSAPASAAGKPGEKSPDISDDAVFSILVDAQAGKYDKEKGRQLIRQAQELIDGLSSDRILEVIRKAKRGEFGDSSSDVLIVAKDALVESNAKETIEFRKKSEESQTQTRRMKEVSDSFARANKAYPELN